jgi:hypothetical protein
VKTKTLQTTVARSGNSSHRLAMIKYNVGMSHRCHGCEKKSPIHDSVFAFRYDLWYGSDMLKAYLGIVSHSGIELFCPEDPVTAKFLERRVRRERGRTAGFWSVLSHEAVELVEAALGQGLPRLALDLLQQQAHDYGFLVPDREEARVRLARRRG